MGEDKKWSDRLTEYIEERRAAPRQDLLTALAEGRFSDGSLPEVIDVVRVAANLFSAGQETTVRLLAASLRIIAESPDIQQQLRSQPERITDFVEEVLRYEGPVKGDFRLAQRTTEVGGASIPAGSTIMVINGAANRDPRRFDQPDEFRLDRENSRDHRAFGRGRHACPGGPLARAEARISIERLLARTTDIRLGQEHGPAGGRTFEYAPTYILRGLNKLHLQFDPAD